MSIVLSQIFELIHCYKCGVAFALPQELVRSLRETHISFYCPNGHGQSYLQETEAEKYRRLLVQQQNKTCFEQNQREEAERRLRKLQKRLHVGVCPCCNRSFENLKRHMASKHKDFGKTLPPTNLAVVKAS